MGKRYYDLLVSLDLPLREGFGVFKSMGFFGVGVSASVGALRSAPSRALEVFRRLKEVGESEGVDVVTRVTVDEPLREEEVKRLLRKWRKGVEVMSVHALSRELTALACRDARVDIVTLVPGAKLMRGDLAYVKEYGKRLELTLKPLQNPDPLARARALAYYKDLLKLTVRKELEGFLVFSSSATTLDGVRDPRSMATLLHTLGLPSEASLDALSRNATSLVAACRDKLRGVIPVRGVRVVRGGERCGQCTGTS